MTNIDNPSTAARQSARPGSAASSDLHTRASALRRRPRPVMRLVILGVIALADVVLAVPAFNAALRTWWGLSVFCAIAFSLVTVLAAFMSGRELKLGHRPIAVAAALATVTVIGGLFVLRLYAAALHGTAATYEGEGTQSDAVGSELALAIVLALLMIATAVLAWIDGHDMTLSPDEAALRDIEGSLATTSAEVGEQEGVIVRQKADRATAVHQLRRIDTDLAEALHGLDALADELVELARYEVVRHLGNPSATSGLDLPRRP